MTGVIKYQRQELNIASGATPTLRQSVAAGFREPFELGGIGQTRRMRDSMGLYYHVIDQATQGFMELPDDLMGAIADQGYEPDRATLERIGQWVEADGERYGLDLAEFPSLDEVEQNRERLGGEQAQRIREARATLVRGGTGKALFGGIVGGVGAGFTDPINLMTLPLAAPARAGLLGEMALQSGLNAAIEAAQTPQRNIDLEAIGLEGDQSALENAAIGALFGSIIPAGVAGAKATARQAQRIMSTLPRSQVRQLAQAAAQSADREAAIAGQAVIRDLDDAEAATDARDRAQVREHEIRLQQATAAGHTGEELTLTDQPTFATPRQSNFPGGLEEVDPRELMVEPDVFQFKSEGTGAGGTTPKLRGVTEWRTERAGVTIVYEYADGRRTIADGHQRRDLATRVMAETGRDDIRLASTVFREADGFSTDDVRVIAALKNIAEAADGMTAAMARDAAKVLRIKPEAIADLPGGPGVARAKSLSSLSDEAFSMYINEVVPERFAELVGRIDNEAMHGPLMKLLERTRPDTTEQASSIIAQAMEAPTERSVVADLFGEQEVVESLYLERAKVLERTLRMLRDDRQTFRLLDERAARIQQTGTNRLDEASNREAREAVEMALAQVKKVAHRAGPISEALNDGAKRYKETGRLKDAASAVASAIRGEIGRNGVPGDGAGRPGSTPKSPGQSATAPDTLTEFADPDEGAGVKAQIDNTRIDPTPSDRGELFDHVPVGRGFDDDGNEIAVLATREELVADLDADDDAVALLETCVR